MKELEKRLIYLFTGELFAVTTFTFIYLRELAASQSYALMYALGVLNFILLQSSFYWFIKWCRWRRKTACVPGLIPLFAVLKKINVILLCIAPLLFLLEMFMWKRSTLPIELLGLFVYFFAIIEYINYFHIQLTNYKKGRGKRPVIAKEIDRWWKTHTRKIN